jgi:hypothetical protein
MWFAHICACNMQYECDLLGTMSNIFVDVSRLEKTLTVSHHFLMTLDGRGIEGELLAKYRSYSWDEPEMRAESNRTKAEVLPRMRNSDRLRRAIRFVVQHQRHRWIMDEPVSPQVDGQV